MQQEHTDSLETLREIRTIMERSARFLSLSGWSGVWAGCTALAGAFIVYKWLPYAWILSRNPGCVLCDPATVQLLVLALTVFLVALTGGLFFTWRKVKAQGHTMWNHSSRQLVLHLSLPLLAGAVFCAGFIYYDHTMYLSPACLIFYGLALINGSKYTLSDIRYLGMFEVALGCVNLFIPGSSLFLWALGFGVLHILYGIIMWNKYDKQ